MADRQTESRPLPRRFGREERIEYPRSDIVWNPRSVVLDLDDDRFAFAARSDGDLSFAAESVHGVAQQVGPHLIQLAAVRLQLRYVRTVLAADRNAFVERVSENHERVVD